MTNSIRWTRRLAPGLAAGLLLLASAPCLAQDPGPAARDRLPQDEVIYFLLPDRFENGDRANDTGGMAGGKLQHGFDPTDEGFYHGGDLTGVIQRLDYIQGLGATAVWLAPIFKNKPVQGEPGKVYAAITATGSPTSPPSIRISATRPS